MVLVQLTRSAYASSLRVEASYPVEMKTMATITKVTDNAHEHRRNKETIFAMMMMKNKMMMMNMNMMSGAKGKGKGASKKNMMYLYAQRGIP